MHYYFSTFPEILITSYTCIVSTPFIWKVNDFRVHVLSYRVTSLSLTWEQSLRKKNKLKILTCPCLSISLLVSLTFSKETTCFRSCSPVNGESGCVYNRHGAGGSAFPATNHDDRWYAYRYRLLSTGTMSITTAYRCSGRIPVKDTLNVGNILLQQRKLRLLYKE